MCVQYIGECSVHRGCSVHWGIAWGHRRISWVHRGYHEYIRGCSVHRGDTMSTSGRYHEYIGGFSVHWGIPWCMWGIPCLHRGMFSTLGDFSTLRDVQYNGVFNRNWKVFTNLLPHMHHDIPRCTEHPSMYSWYPPDVLNIPGCTHDMPRCTEHSPMYWISPDILNTHYTGWWHYSKWRKMCSYSPRNCKHSYSVKNNKTTQLQLYSNVSRSVK